MVNAPDLTIVLVATVIIVIGLIIFTFFWKRKKKQREQAIQGSVSVISNELVDLPQDQPTAPQLEEIDSSRSNPVFPGCNPAYVRTHPAVHMSAESSEGENDINELCWKVEHFTYDSYHNSLEEFNRIVDRLQYQLILFSTAPRHQLEDAVNNSTMERRIRESIQKMELLKACARRQEFEKIKSEISGQCERMLININTNVESQIILEEFQLVCVQLSSLKFSYEEFAQGEQLSAVDESLKQIYNLIPQASLANRLFAQ